MKNPLTPAGIELNQYSAQIRGYGHATTGHEGPEGEMYSSTFSLTSALDEGWMGNTTPRPLSSGKKTQCILYMRLCWPQDRTRRVRKISPPPLPDRPVGSKSLYRISYPSPPTSKTGKFDSVPRSSEPKQVPGPACLVSAKHSGGGRTSL